MKHSAAAVAPVKNVITVAALRCAWTTRHGRIIAGCCGQIKGKVRCPLFRFKGNVISKDDFLALANQLINDTNENANNRMSTFLANAAGKLNLTLTPYAGADTLNANETYTTTFKTQAALFPDPGKDYTWDSLTTIVQSWLASKVEMSETLIGQQLDNFRKTIRQSSEQFFGLYNTVYDFIRNALKK